MTACLQRTSDPSDRIEVSWSQDITLRIVVRGLEIVTGEWDTRISVDGRSMDAPPEWRCVCWHSDRDCNYLELQATLSSGAVIERQILLAREDQYAYFALKVAGTGGSVIEVTTRIPLAAGISGREERDSREIRVFGPSQIGRVFPLALPQDRLLSTAGHFVAREDSLELTQVARGTGLFAPLVIDWDPKRRRSPADWRTLTVAEEGAVVPSDFAAGHRLRIGDEHQLLVYHSLQRSPTGRSVLGHNTRNETVIARFDDSGTVHPVMAVE